MMMKLSSGVMMFGVASSLAISLSLSSPPRAIDGQAAAPKYVGVQKCKLCHQKEKIGNQYAKWEKMDHAKAFDQLASDEAKKIAKEKGIEDPQTSEKCVKCHTTAFGVPAEQLDKNFDPKKGVQCEACHGPGEKHVKARLAAAAKSKGDEEYKPIPAEEIDSKPTMENCVKCHNSESPNFKGFCMKEKWPKIEHYDPRKQHSADDIKCTCDKCKDKKGG